MPGARTTRALSTLLVVLLGACADGCGACDGDGDPAPPEPMSREPAPRPASLVWEAEIQGGAALLRDLRERMPTPELRLLLPSDPAGLVGRLGPDLPPGTVPDDATVWAAGLEGENGTDLVLAAKVARDTLVQEMTLHPGAPHGARWVGAPHVAGGVAAALTGDVLVVAENRASLEEALPYLAFTLAASDEPGADAVTVRLAEGVVSRDLRRTLAAMLEAQVDAQRAAIEAERARRGAPPTLGDPEALLGLVAERVRRWLALLPDVGAVEARIEPAPTGLSLSGTAHVEEGSPLSEVLATVEPAPPIALAALPTDTAAAWSWRSPAGDGEPPLFLELLERTGGDRLDEPARERLRTLTQAIDRATGDTQVIAAGRTRTAQERSGSPWVLWATPDGAEDLPLDVVRPILGGPWLAEVAGALVGERRVRAGPVRTEGPRQVMPLGGEGARLARSRRGTALALAFLDGDQQGGEAVDAAVAARLAEAGRNGLGDHPDGRRALDHLGDSVLAAAVVSPPRLAGLLAGRAPEGASGEGLVVLGFTREEGGLGIRAFADERGLAAAMAILQPLMTSR